MKYLRFYKQESFPSEEVNKAYQIFLGGIQKQLEFHINQLRETIVQESERNGILLPEKGEFSSDFTTKEEFLHPQLSAELIYYVSPFVFSFTISLDLDPKNGLNRNANYELVVKPEATNDFYNIAYKIRAIIDEMQEAMGRITTKEIDEVPFAISDSYEKIEDILEFFFVCMDKLGLIN